MTAPGGKPPVLPLVLLGLMSVACFAGPFLIVLVLRGGRSEGWPPDRPVEWATFVGVTASVAVLMGACLTAGLWGRRKKT